MPVELTAAWWKSHKAKTLLSEPLTKALEGLDKARAASETTPSRELHSALMGATKTVQAAVAQTVTKCNPTLHKDTIANLKQMEAMAKAAYPLLQGQQQTFNKLLIDYQKLRDMTASALDTTVATPNAATIDAATKVVAAMMAWLTANKSELNSEEVMNTTVWFNKSHMCLVDAHKFEQEKNNARLATTIAELKAQVPRIKTTGGFQMPKMGDRSNKPFGQG